MAERDPAAGERFHRLFGLTLASDFPFVSRLAAATGPADLGFSCSREAPSAVLAGEPVYESPLVDESGDSVARLYRSERGELLRFGRALDFHLGERRIDCHLLEPAHEELVEVRLLGSVLAYWLERLGVCALHASAVVVDGRAVAFMAAHHGGKSVLAAALMAAGAPLLTDDLLPIETQLGSIVARPGYPQMRMLPNGLAYCVADREVRRRAVARLGKWWLPVGGGGFGEFHAGSVPLGRVYLPERSESETSSPVRITDVSPRQAVIELLRSSFSPWIVEAVGLQPRRLGAFARLADSVPFRRLSYPSGLAHLPRVRQALMADLDCR